MRDQLFIANPSYLIPISGWAHQDLNLEPADYELLRNTASLTK
jgi:hypothetical protein